jgi:hypothetical protein
MASGLKVNFWKSSLIGVNVSNEFLDMASNFLHCRIGNTPFKYVGLPVGANPRKFSTWEHILNILMGRLRSWGNKYVSLGGQIFLINAVLSAIPIFYLSFLKMPVKVWKEAVKIQRKFLWRGGWVGACPIRTKLVGSNGVTFANQERRSGWELGEGKYRI